MIIRGITMMVLAFVTPAIAEAASYAWKGGDGEWTLAANWKLATGSTPNTFGYPNGVGDQAEFGQDIQAAVRVTIPGGHTVTIAAILCTTDSMVTIVPGDLSPQLIIDRGPDVANIVKQDGTERLFIQAGVDLRSVLRVNVETGTVGFQWITESVTRRGVTKIGRGLLVYHGANSHTGATHVAEGELSLDSASGDSIASGSAVVIGDGTGQSGTAFINLTVPNQIADNAGVEVRRGGDFKVSVPERIGQ